MIQQKLVGKVGQGSRHTIEEAALDGCGNHVVFQLLESHDFKVALRSISHLEVRQPGNRFARL